MTTVEDLIISLSKTIRNPIKDNVGVFHRVSTPWDINFLTDLGVHKLPAGKPLSSKQADVALKIIRRYTHILVLQNYELETVNSILEKPIYKKEPYVSKNIVREVKHVDDDVFVFRFPKHPEILANIKSLKKTNAFTTRNIKYHAEPNFVWTVELAHNNINQAIDLIGKWGFQADEYTLEKLQNILKSSKHIINEKMVCFDETTNKIVIETSTDDFFFSFCKDFLETMMEQS